MKRGEFKAGDVLIVTATEVIGPFRDEKTALLWMAAPHTVPPLGYKLVRLSTYLTIGNKYTAHHCGEVIGGDKPRS